MPYKSLLILILLIGCKADESRRDVSLLAHAGNGLEYQASIYHDNSLEAIHYALQLEGSDGLEVDVQLSADGHLWLYHDPKLDSQTNGEGCIPEQKDEYLSKLKYDGNPQQPICRIEQIDVKLLTGKVILLDIRHLSACKQSEVDQQKMLSAILNWKKQLDQSTVIYAVTNQKNWLSGFKAAKIKSLFSAVDVAEARMVTKQFEVEGLMLKNAAIDKEEVLELRSKGKKVVIFEVRSPKQIRKALNKTPDYLCTDNLTGAITEKYK